MDNKTLIKQYVSIVEDSSWKKLSETEKEVVIKRAGELRQKDTNFAREYQEWLNKKNNEAKLKRKKRNNNSSNSEEIKIVVRRKKRECIKKI